MRPDYLLAMEREAKRSTTRPTVKRTNSRSVFPPRLSIFRHVLITAPRTYSPSQPPHFALSADLIDASNILNTLPTTLKLEDKRLTARLHKLNVYATGGFFKPHRE